jgi:hypothetical protein
MPLPGEHAAGGGTCWGRRPSAHSVPPAHPSGPPARPSSGRPQSPRMTHVTFATHTEILAKPDPISPNLGAPELGKFHAILRAILHPKCFSEKDPCFFFL